jgi:uptake hydrogenase large subunit
MAANPDPEGRITVRIHPGAKTGCRVGIQSSRPQIAQRLLAGLEPPMAVQRIGQAFSLCGQAQQAVAGLACQAAQGLSGDVPTPEPVCRELALEHAWRLLLDWPAEIGQTPELPALLALRQATPEAFAATLEQVLTRHLLGEAPAQWLARSPEAMADWLHQAPTPTAARLAALDNPASPPDTAAEPLPFLPPLADWTPDQATRLARLALEDAGFCGAPTWQGTPAETGALVRTRAHPLLAAGMKVLPAADHSSQLFVRLLARLIEMAEMPGRIHTGRTTPMRAWHLADNLGLAGVETARGLLFHVVRLERVAIANYRILAPTEWNFHPQGPLAQSLAGLTPGPDLQRRARLLCRALDPCVAFDLEIDRA